MAYLTESSLVDAAKVLFPGSEVVPQMRIGKRKIDVAVKIGCKDNHPLIRKIYEHNCDDLWDDDKYELPKTICLYLQFDGPRHYTNNNLAHSDREGTSFNLSDESIQNDWWSEVWSFECYQIRIPYWLQLDSNICKLLFHSDIDVSGGYPHGFIRDGVITPGMFTTMGESRFRKEYCELPLKVQEDIFSSLSSRAKSNDVWNLASPATWYTMIRYSKPEWFKAMSHLRSRDWPDGELQKMEDEGFFKVFDDNKLLKLVDGMTRHL